MKKKIIIGLILFSLIFLLGGSYIILTIESATSKLDNLIMLHQVGILREHLLLQIKKVQSDIHLKNTRYARNIDTIVTNVRNMEQMSNTCFDCHHSDSMQASLDGLSRDVKEYQKAISRLFTIRANTERLETEEDRAFRIGEGLIDKVHGMINLASVNLERKTQASLREIDETKTILFVLVFIVPVLAGAMGYVFIRGFTKPVGKLLDATRKLQSGDLDYRIAGLKDEFGEVAASFNDMSIAITEHMHSIRENEKRYRVLFEGAGDAIFMVDAEGENIGRIVSANKAAADMHGYTIDELVGLNLIRDIDAPEAAREAPDRIRRMLKGEWINAELKHVKKDGTLFPVEASAGLLEYMGHHYIIAMDRDITDRKKSEEALLRSYVMFTTVLDSIDAIIYVADMQTYEVLYINNYAFNIFGDIVGKKCWQTVQKGQTMPCEFCSNDKLLTPEGKPAGLYHWEFRNTINGRWYDIYDRAIEWIDGKIVRLEVATDMTERKTAEQKIKEYAEFLKTLMDTIPLPIFYKNTNGVYTGCNRAFEEFTGRSSAEIIGKTVYDMGPEEIASKYEKKDRELFDNPGTQVYEWKVKRQNGEERDVIFYKATYAVTPGEISGIVGGILDITEQKKMEHHLRRAEQMKLVGEWAAGLAHEIKNSLAGIKISVEVLSDESCITDDDRASLGKAVDEIKRIELLLRKMLNFAKPPELQLFVTNVNEILDNAIEFSLVQSSLSPAEIERIKIVKEYDDNLPETMADRLQLRQVFLNILINANDAMHAGGTLTIKSFYNASADRIQVDISDTGEGIDAKVMKRIFDPFFTTKSKGSGLGLAISKRILEMHEGDISVENKPGAGVVFHVSIPFIRTKKE